MSHAVQTVIVALIVAGAAALLSWRVFGLFAPRRASGCGSCPAKKD
ncbi:MAG TPA: hypothetical protein VEL07_23255 [Planctomycetota bacterium]|nr:hypothetical protein [Planctomycetota bacterium]